MKELRNVNEHLNNRGSEHKNKPILIQVRTYNRGCPYKVERQYTNYGRGILLATDRSYRLEQEEK